MKWSLTLPVIKDVDGSKYKVLWHNLQIWCISDYYLLLLKGIFTKGKYQFKLVTNHAFIINEPHIWNSNILSKLDIEWNAEGLSN